MSGGHPHDRSLFDLLDERLRGRRATLLRMHLESCPTCAARFEALAGVRGALRDLGRRMPAPPAQDPVAEAKLMAALETRGAPKRGIEWWWLPVTAGASVALALLLLPVLRDGGRATPSAAPPAKAQGEPDGKAWVVAVRGSAELTADGESWTLARAGDSPAPGTVLRTGGGSELELRIGDASTLRLGSDSAMRVPPASSAIWVLEQGRLDLVVEPRPAEAGPFGVETPLARIEVMGTDFTVTHDPERTAVEERTGRVRFVSLGSAAEVLLAEGQVATVDGEGRLSEGGGSDRLAMAGEAGAPDPDEAAMVFDEVGDPGSVEAVLPDRPEGSADPLVVDRSQTEVSSSRPLRGTIDQGRVRARVSRKRGAFQLCYGDYMARNPPAAVEARVRFVVLEDGTVGDIDPNVSPPDPAMSDCVVRVFRSITFPRPQGGAARVFYPIRFSM